MSYNEMLEHATEAKIFSLKNCLDIEGDLSSSFTDDLATIKKRVSPSLYKAFKSAIIRAAFLSSLQIRLPKPTLPNFKYVGAVL